jgi:hypothetical protein
MINTLSDSLFTQGDAFGTMHPNADGQSAAGEVIAHAIRSAVGAVLIDPPTEEELCLRLCDVSLGACMAEAHNGQDRGQCVREAADCRDRVEHVLHAPNT